jgi:predicted glycogen debranching enzyme
MNESIVLPVRRISCKGAGSSQRALELEWLVTNGLGGYASGTVANIPTRRYHGMLIAALPAPLGRIMMLHHLSEHLRLPNYQIIRFGGYQMQGHTLEDCGIEHLVEFRLEGGIPVWRFDIEGYVIEKRVLLPYEQNTVHVTYRLLAGDGIIRLKLRPTLHFRGHDAPVDGVLHDSCVTQIIGDRHQIAAPDDDLPPLRLYLHGQARAFTADAQEFARVLYAIEQRRGYPYLGELWSPGYFRANLTRDHSVTLVGSTESWETMLALSPEEALQATHARHLRLVHAADPRVHGSAAAELVLAADQFLIQPAARAQEQPRARAMGDEVRTVIAGYHWFTDWGRDTMISLEGLTLVTGRHAEAGAILRTFAHYVRDGLIPNLFPEGAREGLYHTADATLWFFVALDRYIAYTQDRETLAQLLPTLVSIYDAHMRGTRFGIGVDPGDGLLRQGEEGYQLTWMDAKVGDWVVTPRRGKAVEINALWYNALLLLAEWLGQSGKSESKEALSAANRVRESFNRRFWCPERQHLYDVVDGPQGDDPACRPNQVLAISLRHPVLDRSRWEPVLRKVESELLTPVGLRSLAPDHPDYKRKYFGDLRSRDAAYHQGTVWAWLIGPFIDATLKLAPERRSEVRQHLRGLEEHLSDGCIGSIGEIFDGDSPYHPRGCIAQAWSVAEVLRSLWVTSPERVGATESEVPEPAVMHSR